MTCDPRDPRWSAYVLSELDAAGTTQLEEELGASSEARAFVTELRETASLLGRALDTMPSLELSVGQRRAIHEARQTDGDRHTGAAARSAHAGRDLIAADRRTWRRLAFAGMTVGAFGIASVALMLAQPLLAERAGTDPVRAQGLTPPPAQTARALPEMRFEIPTPLTNTPTSLAISPDAEAIVYVAMTQPFTTMAATALAAGESELWIRRIDSVSPRLLTRGRAVAFPFWSPDGRSVGFFADGKLQRIGTEGQAPIALADAPQPRGGAWGPDGTILFAPETTGPIHRIAADGGPATEVTQLRAPQHSSHGFPVFLPDGDRFLFHVQGRPPEHGIYVGTLRSRETRRLLDADAAALGPGARQLLFVRRRTLMAQDFDATGPALRGVATAVAEGIVVEGARGAAAISASAAGPIVFRATPPSGALQLGDAQAVALSPDGRWLAYQSNETGGTTIWVRGFQGDSPPVSPGGGVRPVWRADGSELFYVTRDGQTMSVRVMPGSGGRSLRFESPAPLLSVRPAEIVFAPDGGRVAFNPPPIVVLLNWRSAGS